MRLAKREAQTWRRVEALVATRKQSDYDEAVRLLKDLKDLGARKGRAAEARLRIHSLRDEHKREGDLRRTPSEGWLAPRSFAR